jgi:uncharacterized repeat protein (TIGR03803 family)
LSVSDAALSSFSVSAFLKQAQSFQKICVHLCPSVAKRLLYVAEALKKLVLRFNLQKTGNQVSNEIQDKMTAMKSILLATKAALASRGNRKNWSTGSLLAFFAAMGLATAPRMNAQTFTTLYSFGAFNDASQPLAGPILAGNTLYGTTIFGGTAAGDIGTVFAINTDGTGYKILHSFTGGDGGAPEDPLVLSGNTLYGTTSAYGSLGGGTVFAINIDGTSFTNLYSFTGGSDGASPDAGLTLSGNTLYGITFRGSDGPTIFAINTDGTSFTTLHDFVGSTGSQWGGLVLSGATLYGMEGTGGSLPGDVAGAVFSLNTNGNDFTTLYNFTGGSGGGSPYSTVTLSGSALYGTTSEDYVANGTGGTVFTMNTNGTGFTNLYTFTGGVEGSYPEAVLILSGNTLYGTTRMGGISNSGTIFSINTDGKGFTTLYTFTSGSDGSEPNPELVLSNNTLYGTTAVDGSEGGGTVFSLTLGLIATSVGSLQVTIEPSGAVSNGAQWQVDGGTLQSSGAIVSNLSVGNHTVSFNTISDWTTPANQTVSISSNSTTTATGTYTVPGSGPTGALSVTLEPAGAVSAGALWKLDFGTAQNSGVTITNVSVGSHTLSFTTVSGWDTPADQTVTITSNLTTTATGIYTAIGNGLTGALSVTLEPAGAVAAGAQWQVDGGAGQASGAIVTNLVAGSHTVSFALISGWNAPSNQTVTITNGATTSATGLYTASITPSDGVTLRVNGDGAIEHATWPKLLQIGQTYTVRAVPNANTNSVFSNWSGGTHLPYAVLSTSPTYTFVMQSNLALEANFGTNIFLPVRGAYRGLFGPTFAAQQLDESGSFLLNLTRTGAFSGDLSVRGQTLRLAGKFGLDGAASLTLKRSNGESTLTTTLQLVTTNQSISGTVTDGTFLSILNGNRDVFSHSNQATRFAGQYTLIIPGTNLPATPFGTSYGTVKVDDLGNIRLAGSLADGTAISQSSVVSKDGNWPLYINLYRGNGSLWGWVNFTNQTLTTSSGISWISTGNPARNALYGSGFDDQGATLTGGLYQPGRNLPPGLIVTLQGGDLPSIISITNFSENTNKLTLKTNDNTGVVSGSFANPNDPKQTLKFNGVILQGQTNAQGYFLGSNQSGIFTLGPP